MVFISGSRLNLLARFGYPNHKLFFKLKTMKNYSTFHHHFSRVNLLLVNNYLNWKLYYHPTTTKPNFNKVFQLFARHSTTRSVNSLSPLAVAFNSKPTKLLNEAPFLSYNKGLFGVEELCEPSGFYLLKERAIMEADKLLQECCSPHRTRKMVEVFDHLSNSLCKVADLAEFIRMSHPNYQFATAAEDACISIGSLVEKLNTHKPLFDALKNVCENGDCVPTTEVDEHVAKLFLFDFEQSGIHLNEEKRIEVANLNEEILTIGQRFLHGTQEPRAVPKKMLPEGIRHHFTLHGDNVVVGSTYSDSIVETTREAAYKIYLHPESLQENRLAQLLKARHEMASLCGFPSFAHRAVQGSLAESPELINEFLNQLTKDLKLGAQNEFDEMNTMKKEITRSSKILAPWDVAYITAIAKQKLLPPEVSDGISSYFSLGTCMEGLNDLFGELFHVRLQAEVVESGELWTNNVYKLGVYHNSTNLLGYIYCDFFEAHQKAHQDCHFTIKGGKCLEDGSYQNPVVVLHLNLPAPTWSTPCLLSLSMLENLFHEMGHAVHSMLARTKYQHVTGTRCSTDFAEVPSILMEFFANDARVLHGFAKHYKTGEKLPIKTLEKVLASKYIFSAVELQLQTFYSVLDQRYHGSERWSDATTTTDILAEVQSYSYGLPYVPNTAWQLRFGHLVGYGAKYYAYLMSRAVASWIWQKYFHENPFNRDAGEKLFKEVLQHGGGKPPQSMVAEFLGRKITSETLVSALLTDLQTRKEKLKNVKR